MVKIIVKLLVIIINILPNSPFQGAISESDKFDFLPYLNWFVPFDNALNVTRAWLVCILVYYNWDYIQSLINKYILKKL